MPELVTDPEILAHFGKQESEEITDPNILAYFGKKEPEEVTDPEILSRFSSQTPDAFLAPAGEPGQPQEQPVAAPVTPNPQKPRNESSYRDIAARYLGTGNAATRLAGSQQNGMYPAVKGDLNELGTPEAKVSHALESSNGDIDKALAALEKPKQQMGVLEAFGVPFTGSDKESVNPEDAKAVEHLRKLKGELDAAGVPAEDHPRIIADAAKANAWSENESDNVRKLSTGELALNPGRLFGQRGKIIADINAADTSPVDKNEALGRLDAMRTAAADKLANDLHYGDVRLPGAQEFRDFAAANPDKDTPTILDEWMAQQKDRGAGWKFIDSLVSGVSKGALGIGKTVVGSLAGATAATGLPGAETLGGAQQLLGDTRESVSQAEKVRSAGGITSDIADTVTQMAPMFVGGAAAQGLKGIAQTAVQGMSVYGWAAAQGYESKLDDAVSLARDQKGADLTAQEVTSVLGSGKTQLAAFLNGFQTAVLSKVLGEGTERAALGHAAESMTVVDFIKGGGAKTLRDGTLKSELKAMGKTVLKDASDETVEEFTNQVLDDAISTVALGKDMKLGDLLENAAYSGAMGGLVGGVAPQVRHTEASPAEDAARDLAAGAAAVAPESAAAALETPSNDTELTKPLANSEESPLLSQSNEDPNLKIPTASAAADTITNPAQEDVPTGVPEVGLQPTSGGPAMAGSENLTPQTNENPPLELQVPGMPENESGAAPESAAAVSETGTAPPEGVSGPASSAEITPQPQSDRRYTVAHFKSGEVVSNPRSPMTHQEAVTFRSKFGSPNDFTLVDVTPTQNPNEPNPQGQEQEAASPEAAQPTPADAGTPGGPSSGDAGTAAETQAQPQVADSRLKLLSELGKPADPAFPDKVTTPEGAVLELTQDGDKIKASISVPPENRHNGAGTAAMQSLVDLARRDGVTIDLDVEPTGANPEPGMGKPELTAWYSKFGFTDNGDGTMTLFPEPEAANPPTPELPNFATALEGDSATGLYHAQSDADRVRAGLPPRFKQPVSTDKEAWDRATAAEDAHRAAGKPGTAGSDLLTNLLSNAPRVLTKDEHALMLHEKLVREQAVEKSQAKLNELPADTSDGERKDAQASVKKAQDAFDLLLTYADAAGSRAGLSLQARKMLVNQDYSLASVVNRLKAAKNMNSDVPAEWSAKDQQAAVDIASKLQQAQERQAYLESALNQKDETVREQASLIEELTKDVERAQAKLENRMRTSRSRAAVKTKLDPLIEAARKRIEDRAKANRGVMMATIVPTPDMVLDLKDYAIIYSLKFAESAVTLNAFSQQVISDLGDWVAPHVERLFRMARANYIETAESVTGGNAPTAAEIVKDLDASEPLDKSDVWKLARAHVLAGLRGKNVLDAVFGDLSAVYPNLTREQVSEAFTGYGTVVYPSDKEVPKELRRIRSLEREYSKQADISKGQMPKRTGYQGDKVKGKEWAEVREEQKKSIEALRELENRLREAGLPVPSDERKLANALGTMKRRLANEIEEIELALKNRTPRTPSSRTPIAPDVEAKALKQKLDAKRAEYEQVFHDESAREKRILGSLKKRRIELERRMDEKDFSTRPTKEPLNTEAKRKADYEFAKVRSKYDEMRHQYLLDNASAVKKAGHYIMSTGNLLKLLTLGGDVGVVMRQLGTTYQAITRDLGMLAPTKEGAKKRAGGSYLKKILAEGVKSFGNAEYEHAAYERLMERDNAGWDKTAGLILSAPFDVQKNSKEDIPPANLLDSIPWWVWPAFAGVKVSLLGSSFPVSASLLALGAVTKPLMQSLDRAQRTMTNQSRAMFFDEALNALHDGHPTVQEAKAIAKAVMVGTGRGTATQKLESAIPMLNQVLLATRYYISRIQALTLYPLLSKDARTSPAAQKEIARMYGRSVAGRAVMYGLAALAFGKALGGAGDDEPEEGLIIDPRNPNFGRLKLAKGVSLDFLSGLNNFASAAVRYATKTRVDPQTGHVKALGAGFSSNVNDEALRFLQSKMNIQLSFLVNTHKGEYFGGKPATFANALEEISTAIIVNDTFNTYKAMMEEYGDVKGAARATVFLGMMFGGAGTSVYNSEAEKEANRMAQKETERDRKLREAELNEP